MRRDHERDERRRGGAAGFTLVELLVVIAIIGLIISLVLVAAADGVRRAEERATQSLITKLETGLLDRLDALLNAQAPVNQTHRYLAAINFSSAAHNGNYIPVGSVTSSGSDERRAQVIAQFDYIKAELPDVFFVQANLPNSLPNTADGGAFTSSYLLNFAAAPYPAGTSNYANYYLPLGNVTPGLPYVPDPTNLNNLILTTNPPQFAPTLYNPPHSGIFGASFSAAGGIYKNLYAAAASDVASTLNTSNPPTPLYPNFVMNPTPALDGVDNNNDGLIDDISEVVVSPVGDQSVFNNAIYARLAKHTHKTARAEMLYAVLVEGLGPLGSVFNRDEFTAREVQDTDGDGLPEFVDAWGEPLQFYRWPIYFGGASVPGSSDLQKGSDPYSGYPETRELDPLDPNQLLVSPGWWSAAGNLQLAYPTVASFGPPNPPVTGNYPPGPAAMGFMHYFHSLVDPSASIGLSGGLTWDRTGVYPRRAFFSKFLILSAGPDKEPGVAQFTKDYVSLTSDAYQTTFSSGPLPGVSNFNFPNGQTIEHNALSLIAIENQASQSDPSSRQGSFQEVPAPPVDPRGNINYISSYLQLISGLDDISNHNIQAPGTGVR